MKLQEKLDLILKGLYQYSRDGEYHSLNKIVRNGRIPLTASGNLKALARKLADEGLIIFKDLKFELKVKITEDGLRFCEHTSYAYQNYPIITHLERKTIKEN